MTIPSIWVLYFMMSFRVLSRLPLGIIQEILTAIFLLLLFAITLWDFLKQLINGKVKLIFLILFPLMVLPFITAYQANVVFGQPIVYGLIAQRLHFVLLCANVAVIALEQKWLSIGDLHRYFKYSILLSLAFMLFFYVFVDPTQFSGTEFVKSTLLKGDRYDFPNQIVMVVMLYSVINIWLNKKPIYYIPFILSVFSSLFYVQDRSQLLFVAITIFLLFIFHLNLKKKLIYFFTGILAIIFMVGVIFIIKPDIFEKYLVMYNNAVTVITGGTTTESSTLIRYVESATALKGIKEHPWLGNGFLSSQWHDGYMGAFGYFYPSDIGILGNVFVYGYIGTFFIYIMFIYSLTWAWRFRKSKDVFLLTSLYVMVFLFLDMITAATNIKYLGLPTFFFGILYYYRFNVPMNKIEMHSPPPRKNKFSMKVPIENVES